MGITKSAYVPSSLIAGRGPELHSTIGKRATRLANLASSWFHHSTSVGFEELNAVVVRDAQASQCDSCHPCSKAYLIPNAAAANASASNVLSSEFMCKMLRSCSGLNFPSKMKLIGTKP